MKPTTIEGVKGKDLPSAWAKIAEVGAEDEVEIIIRAPGEDLIHIAERIREKAKARGMTKEIFDKLIGSE